VRLGLYGLLLYLSNYLSFAGLWASLGAFVLLLGDRRLLKGFFLVSGILAVPCGLEFAMFHTEFVAIWPPPEPQPLLDVYRAAFLSLGFKVWQVIPLIFLAPAGIYLFRGMRRKMSLAMKLGVAVTLVLAVGPLFADLAGTGVSDFGPAASWSAIVLFSAVPLTFFLLWRRLEAPGLWARAALLAGLILVIAPLLTVAAGKNAVSLRHSIEILPAALVLVALVTAGLLERIPRGAPLLFAAMLLWPNLCFNFIDNDQVVERQYLRDESYNGPLIDFLRRHTRPGDRIAFCRNVQGMVGYFYLPEMRWVDLLDSDAPRSRQFRGRLPDDQFDDYDGADWYVVWDPRDGWPKQLREGRYDKVWEYSYLRRQNWWDRHAEPVRYTFEVYKRTPGAASEPSGAGL
jgi:hypothetical protein